MPEEVNAPFFTQGQRILAGIFVSRTVAEVSIGITLISLVILVALVVLPVAVLSLPEMLASLTKSQEGAIEPSGLSFKTQMSPSQAPKDQVSPATMYPPASVSRMERAWSSLTPP